MSSCVYSRQSYLLLLCIKAILFNKLPLSEVCFYDFWYYLQILIVYGHVKDRLNVPVIPTGRLGCALCSSVVWVRAPREYVRKAFTA